MGREGKEIEFDIPESPLDPFPGDERASSAPQSEQQEAVSDYKKQEEVLKRSLENDPGNTALQERLARLQGARRRMRTQ